MSQMKTFIMEIQNILHADELDIIFEGRNKSYGAYELRKTYNRRLITSLIITAACCLSLYAIYASGAFNNSDKPTVFVGPDVILDKVPENKPKQIEVTPPPPLKK